MQPERHELEDYKELLKREFEILDSQPEYIRLFIHENGSPVRRWILLGKTDYEIRGGLRLWYIQEALKRKRLPSRDV